MKKFGKLTTLALCALCMFSMTACSLKDVSLQGVLDHGTLVIATSPDFPPFEYKEGKETVGWDIDVAKEFAKDLGVKLKIVDTDFDGVLAAPTSNKAHVGMAGISYSEERDKNMDFTDTVFDSKQVIIVKKGSTAIKKLSDLNGKKLAAQKGTVGYLLASKNPDWDYMEDENGESITPDSAEAYKSGALAVNEVISGRRDAVIIDLYPARSFVAANADDVEIVTVEGSTEELAVFEDSYAFILKDGNTTLRDKLNELIAKYKSNGFFDELNAKYVNKEFEA